MGYVKFCISFLMLYDIILTYMYKLMKKIFIFICLAVLLDGAAFCAQTGSVSYLDVQTFSENGLFGLKDINDTIVVKPQYKKLIRLGESAWIIQKKNRFGIIDNGGNYIVKPKYRHADRVFGKFAKLGNERDYGLYDATGKAIIPHEYSSIDPLFGKMFLVGKNFKYGIVDFEGKKLLNTDFDDIYMPDPHKLRLKYEGEWYEIERMTSTDIVLPEGVRKVTINNKDFKVTHLVENTGVLSGYSVLTVTDYSLKLFSSISPAYEETIDELMLSQGAETVSIFMKLGWIPRFPVVYAQKYINNLRDPNSGPLSDVRNELRRQIK